MRPTTSYMFEKSASYGVSYKLRDLALKITNFSSNEPGIMLLYSMDSPLKALKLRVVFLHTEPNRVRTTHFHDHMFRTPTKSTFRAGSVFACISTVTPAAAPD
jgi:hypothetical protein